MRNWRKDNENVCTYYYLAKEYYRKHKIQKFLDSIDTIKYINPKDEDVYIFKAHIYAIYNNNEKFYREFAELLKEIPDSVEANLHVAQGYEEILLDYDKALKYINIAINLKRDKPDGYYYYVRGSIYYDMGKYENAIKDYTKSIELNPDNESAYYFRSCCYEKIGKAKEAEADKKMHETLFKNQIEKRSIAKRISLIFYPIRRQLFYTKVLL